MKNLKLQFLLTIFILGINISFSQTWVQQISGTEVNTIYSHNINVINYLPLKTGNIWIFDGHHSIYSQCSTVTIQKLSIDSLIIINNHSYYKLNYSIRFISGYGSCNYSYFQTGYYRIDSLTGNLFRHRYIPDTTCNSNPNEILFDSLNAKLRDTAYPCPINYNYKKILTDSSFRDIFGTFRRSKFFTGGGHENIFGGIYSENIGISYFMSYEMSVSNQSFLKGCVIDGIVYGDTNYYLVGLESIHSELPNKFQITQNFPNPFNPTTQISFNIPKSTLTMLIVYDQLGREVEILVDNELAPGSYKYEWDASKYPSGIYFYKLQAGEFVETKKMVLIK